MQKRKIGRVVTRTRYDGVGKLVSICWIATRFSNFRSWRIEKGEIFIRRGGWSASTRQQAIYTLNGSAFFREARRYQFLRIDLRVVVGRERCVYTDAAWTRVRDDKYNARSCKESRRGGRAAVEDEEERETRIARAV